MTLAERYASVRERIVTAAQDASRDPGEIELIVVTKLHPVDLVIELYELGHRAFGENKDQEAAPKARLLAESGRTDANWHFVGQLQSNKVKSVIHYADTIHSIDRPSLVTELSKQLTKEDRKIRGFLELNLTGEPHRGGVTPGELQQLAEMVLETGRIQILGVMAVAGLGVDPKLDFERARMASLVLQQVAPEAKKLSLGMSEDFEAAIAMGATHLRIGSAITGPRPISA